MSDIILLSIKDDSERISPLLDTMVEERLDVWWEQIDAGSTKTPAANIKRIRDARAVILIWSKSSSIEEAREFQRIANIALKNGSAICVRIDDIELPTQLSSVTIYDLRDWRAQPNNWRKWLGGNLFLREIVAAAKFKVAGKDPPPPDAARKMLYRQVITILPAVGAAFYFVTTAIGLWVDLDLAKGASNKEETAWTALQKDSCNDLRSFLTKFPNGYYANQTQARLDGRTIETQRQWEKIKRVMPLYIGSGDMEPSGSRQLANEQILRRAETEAANICSGLAEAGQAKLVDNIIEGAIKGCDNFGGQFSCSYEGKALCEIEEPRDIEVEICR